MNDTPSVSKERPAHSRRQLIRALKTMEEADCVRLIMISAYYAVSLRWHGLPVDAEDLVQEVFVAALEKKRRWPRGVAFMAYLIMTMRGITWREIQKWGRRKIVPLSGDESFPWRHEQVLIARDLVAKIFRLYSRDRLVLSILRLLLQGFKRDQIVLKLRIQPSTYDATLKRIRNDLKKRSWLPRELTIHTQRRKKATKSQTMIEQ